MARISVATIDQPEFINVTPCNPLISECEIKVLYVGENRNHSFITKEVATEMANTLPGCPIVGWYKESKEDFADHGEKVTFDDEGMHFECMTKPYGFVAPNAKVWFQKFQDTDDFGNIVEREYLMTNGYLWTGQFEEAKSVLEGGRPQSMELDEKTLQGNWSTNNNNGVEFFIINDAIFSKLCILGDDVEPCFEGASVTSPQVSASFTKVDDEFKTTLFSMMQELKFALEGGQQNMGDNLNVNEEVLAPAVEETEVPVVEENVEIQDNNEQVDTAEIENNIDEPSVVESEFAKADDKEEENKNDKKEEDKNDKEPAEDDEEDSKKKFKCGDDDEEKKKYELLQTEFTALQEKYSALVEECSALVEFRNNIENEKKDALINSFYMLSEEDKKEVVENKTNYSLDQIEAKLSVICVRKKVSFAAEQESEKTNDKVLTYSLVNEETEVVPEWVQACRNNQK